MPEIIEIFSHVLLLLFLIGVRWEQIFRSKSWILISREFWTRFYGVVIGANQMETDKYFWFLHDKCSIFLAANTSLRHYYFYFNSNYLMNRVFEHKLWGKSYFMFRRECLTFSPEWSFLAYCTPSIYSDVLGAEDYTWRALKCFLIHELCESAFVKVHLFSPQSDCSSTTYYLMHHKNA